MKLIAIRGVLPFLAIGLSALVNGQSTPTFLEWTISPGNRTIQAGFSSTLRNEKSGKFLINHIQPHGVPLGFEDSQTFGNIAFFISNATPAGPTNIPLGRQVSLKIYPGRFLTCVPMIRGAYVPKSTGPRLELSPYWTGEWLLIALGEIGTPVGPTTRVGLYNIKARDFLVFEKRQSGVSLGWSKNNKTKPYQESHIFIKNLEKQGFKGMHGLLRTLLK